MIEVKVNVNALIEDTWAAWNALESINQWAFASDDWGAEALENTLEVGGRLSIRNYSKQTGEEFIMGGVYTEIQDQAYIEYVMDDARKVQIEFVPDESGTSVIERFDPENENSEDVQRSGWQAILENFKKYVESTVTSVPK